MDASFYHIIRIYTGTCLKVKDPHTPRTYQDGLLTCTLEKVVAMKNFKPLTIFSTYLVRCTPTLIKTCTFIANTMENKISKVNII